MQSEAQFEARETSRRRGYNRSIEALISKKNVLIAVILRDMRSRFFNHGLGFIMVPLWPLVHMGVLILIHSTAKSDPYFGDSLPLFFATGLVPTLTFMYVSRFMVLSIAMNKPMLSFPIVTTLDVMFGRAILEILAACITLTLIMVILWICDNNPWPIDLETVVSAYLCVIFLALGCGFFIGVLSKAFPMLVTAYQLFLICIYITSGTMFVASNLPDYISYMLSYNPITECVEWIRTGYYDSYSDKLVHPYYIISIASATLLLGLGIERAFRRFFLEA
ncbi:MAG: capsular biosynthesis protein [Rhizobium sp.]|nr:MAG: capsular biosynthesis protein [Rhizobium sp.]